MSKPIEPITYLKPEFYPKAWGGEIWIVNNDKYCGKILQFNKGAAFSFHFHVEKTETWYVLSGKFILITKDLSNGATIQHPPLTSESVIHIPAGNPHQLICQQAGEILEVSTQHFEHDSYRIEPGDSQK